MRKQISGIIRWLLVTLLILLGVGGAVWAYTALTSTGEITVEECLSFVGPSTFSVSLYPQESETVQLTVANASSQAIGVDLLSTVTPDPGAKGLTVGIPNKITAPAIGQVVVVAAITAMMVAPEGVTIMALEVVIVAQVHIAILPG